MSSKSKQSRLLPNRKLIRRYLNETQNVCMREYYGSSWQDRIRSWIFRQRYSLVLRLIKYKVKVNRILDVGSGPMFIAHSLIMEFNAGYVGVDLLPRSELRKYTRVLELSTGRRIDVVRASAEYLPFRDKVFDSSLSLDVLEHLQRPQAAMNEMNRVVNGNIIVSVPIENTFQKVARLPILLSEGTLKDPTPEYHYIGPFKSYREMWEKLLRTLCLKSEYAPFGMIHKESFNFYAIHLCRTRNNKS